MFNAETKERYRVWKESITVMSKNVIALDFQKTEPFEENLNKDIYDFTVAEIINMYKTFAIKSVDTLYNLNSRLVQYVSWALGENLVFDSQNHFEEINREMILECTNYLINNLRIITKAQVLAWCSKLPNASDKFCILGAFEGLNGEKYSDFWNVSINDFDEENMELHLPDRTMKVSRELLEFAKEANEMISYTALSGKMSRQITLVENGKILKDKTNTRNSSPAHHAHTIYRQVSKICVYLGISDWFNIIQFQQAGLLQFVVQRCAELNVTPKDYFFTYPDWEREIKEQYGRTVVRSSFYTKYKTYFEEEKN